MALRVRLADMGTERPQDLPWREGERVLLPLLPEKEVVHIRDPCREGLRCRESRCAPAWDPQGLAQGA